MNMDYRFSGGQKRRLLQHHPVLVASDALSNTVLAVNGESRPTGNRTVSGIYAVFASKDISWESGVFLGCVTEREISYFPLRIFMDLIDPHPPEPIKHNESLEVVLKRMNSLGLKALPVLGKNGKPIGIVTIQSILEVLLKRERTLLEETSKLQTLLELDQERITQWSERLVELLAASRTLLGLLSNTTVEGDLLQSGIEALCKLIQAKYGAIGILDENGGLAQFFYTGMSEAEVKRISHFPEGRGLLGVVVHENTVIRLEHIENDPRSAGFPAHHPKMESLLAVPISNFDRMYGRIYLCDKIDGSTFSTEDEMLTSSFAHSLSLILDNAKEMNKLLKAQEKLAYLADHDALTELPNRKLVHDLLEYSIAARNQTRIAVLFLDLDNFKTINDSLGHRVGDQLLIVMSKILMNCVRECDTVARIGGDEFVLVLLDIVSPENAAVVAQKIIDAISQPVTVHGNNLRVSASVGISIYPDDGVTVDSLMKGSDIAMYQAKGSGKNTYRFFTSDMDTLAKQRLEIEKGLRRAIDSNEFYLHYQPKIDFVSGNLVGAEVLLRWKSLDGVNIPPATFIPIAEESGLIVPIGNWVLETACKMGKEWHDAGFPWLIISVNLSARQLWKSDFKENVERILSETGFNPNYLDLELTETALMRDIEHSASMISDLKEIGISISIDDFGTGYSSLSYLKYFRVDYLKIDQSFVRDIEIDPNDMALSEAIIVMAHKLGMNVIAEGVETEGQKHLLVAAGCDQGQGYLFSRPIPPEEFGTFLTSSDHNAPTSGKRLT